MNFGDLAALIGGILAPVWLVVSLITGKTPNLFNFGVGRAPVLAHRRLHADAYWAKLLFPALVTGAEIWFGVHQVTSN